MKKRLFLFCFSLALGAGVAQAQTVFVTSTGKKYHTKNCELLKEGKKKSISLAEAKRLGYEPCKPCKADEIVATEDKKKPAASQ